MSRRRFIATSALTAGGAAISLGLGRCDPAFIRRLQQNKVPQAPHHRVWVWQFSADGALSAIASSLSGKNIGVVVKTHDGIEWMSTYDHSPDAITGPGRAGNVGQYLEDRGIPFHAWCVVKGVDPEREAQMAADVLAAGARSLVLDLEGSSGFWLGGVNEALRYGQELRRLTPFGRVDISIDPRPWRMNLVPMPEFVAFTDGIWPQLYWETFDTPANIEGYTGSGFPVPGGRITPEFLLDATARLLQPYERDVIPVGQGAANDPATWPRFAHRAWELGMQTISDWRLGVTSAQTLQYFADNPPGVEPVAPKPTTTPTSNPFATKTKTPAPTRTRTNTPVPANTATNTPVPATASHTPLPATATATKTPSLTATFTSTPAP